MKSFGHVLVATDFGPASERAVDLAARLAKSFGANVTVVHVIDVSYWRGVEEYPGPCASLDVARKLVEQRLDAIVRSLMVMGIACRPLVVEGVPVDAIVGAAAELDADVVIVGSHGQSGLQHALLGSVAERVVRCSTVPVLTVHGSWFEDRAEAGVELATKLGAFRAASPVVLAISPGGILVAAELADALNARLELLLVREVHDGSAIAGAVCEDGTIGLAAGQSSEALGERHEALFRAMRDTLASEGRALRGRRIRDLWRRAVVIVSDELVDARCALLAVDVVERMGPREIRVAAPLATTSAIAALEARVSAVVASRVVIDGHPSPEAIYRTGSDPKVLEKAIRGRLARRAA